LCDYSPWYLLFFFHNAMTSTHNSMTLETYIYIYIYIHIYLYMYIYIYIYIYHCESIVSRRRYIYIYMHTIVSRRRDIYVYILLWVYCESTICVFFPAWNYESIVRVLWVHDAIESKLIMASPVFSRCCDVYSKWYDTADVHKYI